MCITEALIHCRIVALSRVATLKIVARPALPVFIIVCPVCVAWYHAHCPCSVYQMQETYSWRNTFRQSDDVGLLVVKVKMGGWLVGHC